MNIPKIEAIGFDWDGTLVDSMFVKAQAFAESIIKFYSSAKTHRKEIEESFIAYRGTPRLNQLKVVQERYKLGQFPEGELQRWSDLFTSLYIDKKLPLFDDVIDTLTKLKSRDYVLFLNSSVPQNDLDRTLKMYPLENFFDAILGTGDRWSFVKGIPHLNYISKHIGVPLTRIAFVGDASADVKGANEAGCFSIGKADPRIPNSKEEMKNSNPGLIIENLSELLSNFL